VAWLIFGYNDLISLKSRKPMPQLSLFPELTHQFPSTRYQGSKAKLLDWLWQHLRQLEFQTCLDAFGGTAAVAYQLKTEGKQVTYNDILQFNYRFGHALIENKSEKLLSEDIDWLLARHTDIDYPSFVESNFHDIYFTDAENHWIDQSITNIRQMQASYKQSIAFFALAQACIVKRPYNLFHRKNLYIRFAEVERSFGNKASWDKPFEDWFRFFVDEANRAVFDNGQANRAFCGDALTLNNHYDLVYIDPPYISRKGLATDYRDFYHFLEGLAEYETWEQSLDRQSKHHRLKRQPNPWTDKQRISGAFDKLFERFAESILVVSYRSDGIPSQSELLRLMRKYKSNVQVESYGQYQYALSTNKQSQEILLIGR
jgi:adenine-specific DNA-methyltransferase